MDAAPLLIRVAPYFSDMPKLTIRSTAPGRKIWCHGIQDHVPAEWTEVDLPEWKCKHLREWAGCEVDELGAKPQRPPPPPPAKSSGEKRVEEKKAPRRTRRKPRTGD